MIRLSYRWQVTLVIALGMLMAVLDTTIVSVVLPQIATAFKTDFQTITWVGTGYFLANAAVIPVVGYISDRIGVKIMFLLSLGLFTLGSALCAVAPNEQFLIAWRVVQGIGGGALLPLGMATIFRLFKPEERAGAIVLLMVPLLLGPAFGPTLGGYLATNFSWNAIFTINLPIGIVAFVLMLFVMRGRTAAHDDDDTGETEATGFDLAGLLLSMAGFTALVYSITAAGTSGWSDTKVISFLIAGCVLLIVFVIVELRVKDPVIDIRLFRNYSFTMANLLIWVTTAVLFGSLFLLPLFFEQVRGFSALTTGEIVILQGLTMAVGLVISGKLYNTVGPRVLTVLGSALVAVSMIGFLNLSTTTSGADVQLWLILRGLGLGIVGQPLQTLAVSTVSNKQMARASSLISSVKTIFGAVGVAILTTYLTQQTTAHVKDVLTTCVQQVGQQALKLCVTQHALTMGMNDTFLLVLIGCIACTVLAFFVGRDPSIEAAREAKKRGETVEKVPAPTI